METIFLACFAFGVLFTLASVALGALGGIGHGGLHLGHGNAHVAGHIGHDLAAGTGHVHGAMGHQPPGAHLPHDDVSLSLHHAPHLPLLNMSQLPLLNASSAVGALTWFGAAGYLLLRLGSWALPLVILGALLAGAVGWYLVARFLGLVLAGEVEMNPDDYRLEGTVGQLTVSIPRGGTGEVVFEKAGVRRSESARALGGAAIARGSEVVITSYADGFATVQPWTEFLAERDRLAAVHNREA
ncbi:MAG TPA: hypothetical protein VF937_12155 [Chloroflexota bacterium]